MTTKTLNEHIVVTPGVLGGRPRIAGRRIGVEHIVRWHEELGQSAEYIAREYELSLADVYAALAYYYDHKEEIDARTRVDAAFVKEMRRQYPSRVSPKFLKRRGEWLPSADRSAWAVGSRLSWWSSSMKKLHERRD